MKICVTKDFYFRPSASGRDHFCRFSISILYKDVIRSVPANGYRRDFTIFERYGTVDFQGIKFGYDLGKLPWKDDDYLIC